MACMHTWKNCNYTSSGFWGNKYPSDLNGQKSGWLVLGHISLMIKLHCSHFVTNCANRWWWW
jgi:hypothetical protein